LLKAEARIPAAIVERRMELVAHKKRYVGYILLVEGKRDSVEVRHTLRLRKRQVVSEPPQSPVTWEENKTKNRNKCKKRTILLIWISIVITAYWKIQKREMSAEKQIS
jgi:hypothetical protein